MDTERREEAVMVCSLTYLLLAGSLVPRSTEMWPVSPGTRTDLNTPSVMPEVRGQRSEAMQGMFSNFLF